MKKKVSDLKEFFFDDLNEKELRALGLKHQKKDSNLNINIKEARKMEYEFNSKKRRTASSGRSIYL